MDHRCHHRSGSSAIETACDERNEPHPCDVETHGGGNRRAFSHKVEGAAVKPAHDLKGQKRTEANEAPDQQHDGETADDRVSEKLESRDAGKPVHAAGDSGPLCRAQF